MTRIGECQDVGPDEGADGFASSRPALPDPDNRKREDPSGPALSGTPRRCPPQRGGSRLPAEAEAVENVHLLLGAYVLGGLDSGDTVAFDVHVRSCPRCQVELARARAVPEALALLSTPGGR